MAPPTILTSNASANNSTTPKSFSSGARSAGDLIVVVVINTQNSASTYTVTDGTHTYTEIATATSDNFALRIYYTLITTPGTYSVEVNRTSGSSNFLMGIWRGQPDTGATIAFDTSDDFTGSGATKFCADTGQIDTAANVAVFAAGYFTNAADPSEPGDPSGFARDQEPIANRALMWSRTSAGALTDERGAYAGTSSLTAISAIVSFKTVAASGSPVPIILQQHGVFLGGGLA